MNKQRRKDLARVLEYLSAANQPLADALNDLEGIRDEEQESYDNLPESMQDGERGQAMQEAIDALEEAVTALETMTDAYDEIVGAIDIASA